jgi:flagellar assembly factor FliW
MTVTTKAYGQMEADERQRIRFPSGLPGFEKFKEFVLLDARQEPFYYLQSLEVAEIAFILVDPFLFRADYELDISNEEMRTIGVASPAEVLVFAIVTVPPDGGPMTANLMGPILINRKTRAAMQAVLSDARWKTKHDIMGELREAGKAAC